MFDGIEIMEQSPRPSRFLGIPKKHVAHFLRLDCSDHNYHLGGFYISSNFSLQGLHLYKIVIGYF